MVVSSCNSSDSDSDSGDSDSDNYNDSDKNNENNKDDKVICGNNNRKNSDYTPLDMSPDLSLDLKFDFVCFRNKKKNKNFFYVN